LEPDEFPGRTVVFSGEAPRIDNVGQRVYYLGPNKDDINSIMIPYVNFMINIWDHGWQIKLFDHDQKPRNTEKYFLIYSASNCQNGYRRYRDEAFDNFAEIGLVHHGGPCWGLKKDKSKVVEMIKANKRDGSNENRKLYHDYRFALVLENTKADGYISEKILNAFLSGTIPIWYGTTDIFTIFNRRAFIYYDIDNPKAALDQVAYLEQNRTAYRLMLDEPILADGERTLERWFSFTDNVGKGFLKRRIRSMLGYESRMYHNELLNSYN